MSPQNEAFVYREWNPNPNKWVNLTICEEIASKSGNQKYVTNFIDPLAAKIQTNTGVSVLEDFNRIFPQLKKQGKGFGGYWETYDTKGTKGRDEIRKRLQNSLLVERPFNNQVVRDGRTILVPTLWIFSKCRETAKSLHQWRYEEWATSKVQIVKDRREVPSQKFSHFCTALEGIFKDDRWRPRRDRDPFRKGGAPQYFKKRRG